MNWHVQSRDIVHKFDVDGKMHEPRGINEHTNTSYALGSSCLVAEARLAERCGGSCNARQQ